MDFLDYDTRLGAYVVAVADGSVVLTRLSARHGSQWTLPGGGVELHETVEQAAEREMEEETGLTIRLGSLLGVSTMTKAAGERMDNAVKPLKMVRVLFAATVIGGTIRPEAGGTTVETSWFPIHAVAALEPRPHVTDAIRLWQSQSSTS